MARAAAALAVDRGKIVCGRALPLGHRGLMQAVFAKRWEGATRLHTACIPPPLRKPIADAHR